MGHSSRRAGPGFPAVVLAALAWLLSGCADLGYYAYSISGQAALLAARQPLDAAVDDPQTPEQLRARLQYAAAVRDFAAESLGLPDNGSYRTYADLGRRYVAWAVVATPELSLAARTWCFPVAGCVAYRGYFEEAEALRYADALRAEGQDVHVGGVAAYSTLGWFDDPLPRGVLEWPDTELAGLIFHELAHQVAYVRDDTAFNEAFAVTVEEEGVRRWLAARGSAGAVAAYDQARVRRGDVLARVLVARGRLAAIYASDLPAEAMRREKGAVFRELHESCQGLGLNEAERARYRRWCSERPNNARLAAITTYHELAPGFRALLDRHGGDLPAFYQAVVDLAGLPRDVRRERLTAGQPGVGSRATVPSSSTSGNGSPIRRQ
ncbi:MAG: aminopeptidase [Gammaproteobacteria bacterium]|jgi:predicted aminopeptidase|nr:aminopeptidase [Gammaproteobacteria bacterium]